MPPQTFAGRLARRSPPSPHPLARAARAAWRDPRWSWLPPGALATAVAILYLTADPRTSDLPAHLFRAELFGREGFTIWSNQWYGGHHTPAYSLLFPPLAWLLGPRVVGAVACVVAAILFERLARGRFGASARFGALWLGVGVGSLLFTERLTFSLGVATGLAAALALQRRRARTASLLGAASSLASPVAGLFVALAGAAYALAGLVPGEEGRAPGRREAVHAPDDDRAWRRRVRRWAGGERARGGLGLAAAALAPILVLAAAFPERGPFPFDASAYVGIPLLAAAMLFLLPRGERTLRVAAVLYLLGGTAAFALETGAGGNVTRLGSLLGGPVLAAAMLGRTETRAQAAVLAVAFAGLAYWQWTAAVRATLDVRDDPSTRAGYYEPLLERLEQHPPAGRLEIPFLESHFESAYVGARFPLARGWERQLDIERNPLFYREGLDHRQYATWLRENAVSHVAVADAPNDYAARDERRLVDEEPPYLAPVWRSEHWRLYEVRDPQPVVAPERGADVALVELGDTSVTLDVRAPGAALVRVRWTPYWRARGACVGPAGAWTRVEAARRGVVRLEPAFSIERLVGRGRRCA